MFGEKSIAGPACSHYKEDGQYMCDRCNYETAISGLSAEVQMYQQGYNQLRLKAQEYLGQYVICACKECKECELRELLGSTKKDQPLTEVQTLIEEHYPLAVGFEDDVIVETNTGVLRYRKNKVVSLLLDLSENVDMNKLWILFKQDCFPRKDLMEFYRLIGYSLNGFEEIWYDRVFPEEEE